MKREDALPYVSCCVDDTLSERRIDEMPPTARLVGWQCGFEPMFVAVWSYLPNTRLDADEAASLAIDLLEEKGWFADHGCGPSDEVDPDYII